MHDAGLWADSSPTKRGAKMPSEMHGPGISWLIRLTPAMALSNFCFQRRSLTRSNDSDTGLRRERPRARRSTSLSPLQRQSAALSTPACLNNLRERPGPTCALLCRRGRDRESPESTRHVVIACTSIRGADFRIAVPGVRSLGIRIQQQPRRHLSGNPMMRSSCFFRLSQFFHRFITLHFFDFAISR